MKYIPIVAVVSETTYNALHEHVDNTPPPTAEWLAVMQRNGWTIESIVAGVVIGQVFEDRYPSVSTTVVVVDT